MIKNNNTLSKRQKQKKHLEPFIIYRKCRKGEKMVGLEIFTVQKRGLLVIYRVMEEGIEI